MYKFIVFFSLLVSLVSTSGFCDELPPFTCWSEHTASGRVFTGTGWSEGEAAASAENQCLAEEINGCISLGCNSNVLSPE
jgi:hypothetical protein